MDSFPIPPRNTSIEGFTASSYTSSGAQYFTLYSPSVSALYCMQHQFVCVSMDIVTNRNNLPVQH